MRIERAESYQIWIYQTQEKLQDAVKNLNDNDHINLKKLNNIWNQKNLTK